MPNLQTLQEGDAGFLGIDTRTNPISLKEGVLQDGRNIRIEQQLLQVRKGIARILDAAQASIVGMVYGAGVYRTSNGNEKIVLVVSNGLYLFDTETQSLSSKYLFPAGRTITSGPVQVLQAVNKIYILRGEATRYITGNGSTGQRATGNGSGSIITVTTLNPHGLIVGDEFAIETGHIERSGPTVANNFVVASVPTSTSFTYNLTVPHTGGSSGYVIQVGKPVLVFDGTIVNITNQRVVDGTILGGTNPTACSFPFTSTAIYHGNRIFCKYSKDEIAVSDFLPTANGDWEFDLTIQAMTINLGDEQAITGFYPWVKDNVLVFKDNSIYVAKFADDTSSPNIVLSSSYVENLTMELGCVAKNSIANVSGTIFFLSKKGVYALEPQLDANLLANTQPMSIDIQKYIDRINQKYVNLSIGKVYNGRYYLAVPLDSNTSNSHILVYNLTNKMWESVDNYPTGVNPFELLVSKQGTSNVTNRLFFCTQENGLYLSEEKEKDEHGGTIITLMLPFSLPNTLSLTQFQSQNIDGFIKTRKYVFQTMQSKRFMDINTEIDFGSYGVLQTKVITYNPDTSKIIDIATASVQNDKIRRTPIRKVAYAMDIELTSLQGRPTIRTIGVSSVHIGKTTKNEE